MKDVLLVLLGGIGGFAIHALSMKVSFKQRTIENKIKEHALVELSCVSGVGQPAAYAMIVLAEDIRNKMASDPSVKARVESELGRGTAFKVTLPKRWHLPASEGTI